MAIPWEVYIRVILVHAIPLVGVLNGQWDFLAFVFAYWAETYIFSLVFTYLFLLLNKVYRREPGLRVSPIAFLFGIAFFTVLHLGTLAALLKSVSAFLSPGRRASLVELFHLFLIHIMKYNFVVYALVPICINIAFDLSRHVLSQAYRQKTLAAKALHDILWRIFIHCLLIVALALKVSEGVADSVVIVLGFFVIKAMVELMIYKERRTPGSELGEMFDELIPYEKEADAKRTFKRRGFRGHRAKQRHRRRRRT